MHGFGVIRHGLSIMIARKSFTLVNVGPGTRRSPKASKKAPELLSERNAAGSRPRAMARATDSPSTRAPAGSGGAPPPPPRPARAPARAATARHPRRGRGEGGGFFGVGPAAALAGVCAGHLAAENNPRGFPRRARLAGELGVRGGAPTSFAFDAVTKETALIPRDANRRFSRV